MRPASSRDCPMPLFDTETRTDANGNSKAFAVHWVEVASKRLPEKPFCILVSEM
jgi:hypothetical protein